MGLLKLLFGSQEPVVLEPVKVIDPDILVKQIHDEVDNLEDQSIKAVEKMLEELQIPTEDKLVNKAKLMESLGFNKSNETVQQSAEVQRKIQEAKDLKELNEARLKYVAELRKSYPNDKIIPMSEFQKVLTKYNLIYAPSSAYIKDVPEKNLLEIQKSRRTENRHEALDFKVIQSIELNWRADEKFKAKLSKLDLTNIVLNKSLKTITEYEIIDRNNYAEYKDWLNTDNNANLNPEAHTMKYRWWTHWQENPRISEYYVRTGRTREVQKFVFSDNSNIDIVSREIAELLNIIPYTVVSQCINRVETTDVSRSSLFIAAPKSHFDLTNMASRDGKEFYLKQKVEITQIKDPIAFYILRGSEKDPNEEYVRICSKWGTSDDQSYLDPIVQNENLN